MGFMPSSRRVQVLLTAIAAASAILSSTTGDSAVVEASPDYEGLKYEERQKLWKEYSKSSRYNAVESKDDTPWIDPDTPNEARTIYSNPRLPFLNDDERVFDLVFSDEFEIDDRTMHDGHDSRWTALHSDDLTNNPLHYYSHSNVKTSNGVLNITLDIQPQEFTYTRPGTKHRPAQQVNISKEFRAGMVQTWNKFCFIGGIIEISAKMPGDPSVGGLWPAMWMMGNLARATYLDTTDYMWPFSTNACSNKTRYAQEINACNDNPKFGMQPNRGRGAAEIDFLEVMFMDVLPSPLLSASLQIAPGKDHERPYLGQIPNVTWYRPVVKNEAWMNIYFFGAQTYDPDPEKAYQTDTVSINYWLDETFYERPHTYRIEWEPPSEKMVDSPSPLSHGGYIKWFIDGKLIAAIVGDDLQEVSETEIPSEPMYLILNQALSKDWGFPDAYFLNCPKKCWSCIDPTCSCAMPEGFCENNVPNSFEIDYVRIYQDKSDPRHVLGCSPPSRPTAEWIEGHKERYMLWEVPEDTGPLKEISRGGGVCYNDTEAEKAVMWKTCGGDDRGVCDPTMGCLCRPGWTGPRCLSAYSDADVDMYEEFIGTETPAKKMPFYDVVAVCVIGTIVLVSVVILWRKRCQQSKGGYETIPT